MLHSPHCADVHDPIDVARRRCIAVLVLGGLQACAKPPPATPASVSGNLVAAATLNPSVTQRPSPLRLRVYELKSDTAFKQADFMALYQADQATLGAELVARDELTLQPGESRVYARTLAADTRFLGVLAAYRDLEHAVWRSVVAVMPGRSQQFHIHADTLAVTARVQP